MLKCKLLLLVNIGLNIQKTIGEKVRAYLRLGDVCKLPRYDQMLLKGQQSLKIYQLDTELLFLALTVVCILLLSYDL